MNIHFSEPNLGLLEKQYLNEALNSGWVGSHGDFITRFEEKFAKFIGVNHAITCSSGTTALHLAYLACGLRNTHRVGISDDTFIATKNMARLITPNVVYLEAESDTWTLKLPKQSLEHFIIGVHLYGNPCDMGQVYRDKYVFIEDCAHSIGSKHRGKMTGSFGLASVFSFHSAKMITSGEGGMVCTDDIGVAQQVRFLKNQAMTEPYKHSHIGFNYRMTNLQAALGLAQLERIDEFIKAKKSMTKFYNENLSKLFVRQKDTPRSDVVHWANAYKHPRASEIRLKLKDAGIETRPGFLENDDTILLPCSTTLTEHALEYIVSEANRLA